MRRFIRGAVKARAGATAIEYALIAGFLSIVILTAVATLGTSLTGIFTALLAGL
jgi:pilus assembly protein Flp/PilA